MTNFVSFDPLAGMDISNPDLWENHDKGDHFTQIDRRFQTHVGVLVMKRRASGWECFMNGERLVQDEKSRKECAHSAHLALRRKFPFTNLA